MIGPGGAERGSEWQQVESKDDAKTCCRGGHQPGSAGDLVCCNQRVAWRPQTATISRTLRWLLSGRSGAPGGRMASSPRPELGIPANRMTRQNHPNLNRPCRYHDAVFRLKSISTAAHRPAERGGGLQTGKLDRKKGRRERRSWRKRNKTAAEGAPSAVSVGDVQTE